MSLAHTKKFVRECLRAYSGAMIAKVSGASSEIRADAEVVFRLIEAPIDPAPLKWLEEALPAKLPPALHAYLSIGFFRGPEAYEYCLPSVYDPDPLSGVKQLLLCSELWPLGYVQFAHGQCGDPLCFDILRPSEGSEYPVLSFNHDLAPKEAWASRSALRPYRTEVATSFQSLLRGICVPGAGPPPWSTTT